MISIDENFPLPIAGGCVLWKNREWVQSLMDREDSPETVLE